MFTYFGSMQVCCVFCLYTSRIYKLVYFFSKLRFLLDELSPVLSPKITTAQKLPIIKAESRWKTVINSVVSSIKTKKNVRNHKARNQHFPLFQNTLNGEVSNVFDTVQSFYKTILY